jgi:PAS domain S-box-containing protein
VIITTKLTEYEGEKAILGIITDITERKKAEEKLRKVSNEWEATFNSINDLVSIHDKDFNLVKVNKAFSDTVKKKSDELIGKKCYEVVHGTNEPWPDCPDRQTMKIEEPCTEKFYEPKLGIYLQVSTSPIFDEKGEIIGIVHITKNINERKWAEEKFQRTFKELKDLESIINRSPAMAFLWPVKEGWPVEFVTNNVKEVLGYTADDFISGKVSWPAITHHKDVPRLEEEVAKYLEEGITEFSQEYRLIAKSGDVLWMTDRNKVIYDSNNTATHIQSIVLDITGRKKAEEQVKASLNEKEVLLQEIHHRVKNNMTVITSLLQLQSNHIKDENYKEIFNNSINRIKSMALIHEKLYESKDLAKVDFNDYLKDMINSTFMSYGLNSHKIALKTDVEDVALGVDTAIPCGLIINELVSNSLKYAFPEDREGEIKVSLRRNDKAEVELTVSDNGVGMPEDVDFGKTDSLGLNVVNALVRQLHGKIERYKEKGTEFIITFKG